MLVTTCFSVDDATKSGFIIQSFQLGTREYLFYMRSKWARPMFGDANAHYERALALRLDPSFDPAGGV